MIRNSLSLVGIPLAARYFPILIVYNIVGRKSLFLLFVFSSFLCVCVCVCYSSASQCNKRSCSKILAQRVRSRIDDGPAMRVQEKKKRKKKAGSNIGIQLN